MSRKCKLCKQHPAEWTMQYMGEGVNPTFTLPGNHYRGWTTTPVCDECKRKIDAMPESGIARKDVMDSLNPAVCSAL